MEKKAIDDDDDAPNRPSYGTYGNDPVARRASQKTTDRDGVRDCNGSGTMHGAGLSDGEKVTTITMDLASFDAADGLDTWTRKRLSGTRFRPRLTSRCASRTHALLRRWCANSGEVAIYYSGSPAWRSRVGKVPGFCARRRSAAEFTVVPWCRAAGESAYRRIYARRRLT